MSRLLRLLEHLLLGPEFDSTTGRRNWQQIGQAASYAPLERARSGFCGECEAPEDRLCYGGCRRRDPWRRER